MSFDTKKEEKRIFDRFRWCVENLFSEETEAKIFLTGTHLTDIDNYSSFDYHTCFNLFSNNKKTGLLEIRYTNKEIDEEYENYISKDKKEKTVDNNTTSSHRIFLCEHPSCLYIADLNRAKWTSIKPSKLSIEAWYFNKYKTPHIIIPLRREDSTNDIIKKELQEQLRETYNTLNEVRNILIHMTDTII